MVLAFLLIGGVAAASIFFDPEKVEQALLWVQENKAQGSIAYLGVYILGVICMFPAMVMAMAGGAVFGLAAGTLLVWLGSSIGQVIAFIAGRYLLRDMVMSYLTKQFPKWTAIDRAMEREGWKLVTLLRLSPIAPWNVLNYALSVTSLKLVPYTLASSLSIIPYLVMFVYFGSLARNMADIFTGEAGLDATATLVMAIVSAVLIVAIVWYTTHISRRAIGDALMSHADELPQELTGDAEVVTLLGGNDTSLSPTFRSRPPTPTTFAPTTAVGGGGGAVVEMSSMRLNTQHSMSPRGGNSSMVLPGAAKRVAAPLTNDEKVNLLTMNGGGGGAHSSSSSSPRPHSPVKDKPVRLRHSEIHPY